MSGRGPGRSPKIGAAVFAVLTTLFYAVSCGGQAGQGSFEPPEGVKTFEVSDRPRHVDKNVSYPQTPPVGGDHSPAWQNCGFYEAPVEDEMAVHSMEHGAVWITHKRGLPEQQVAELRKLAERQTYVLVSPYPDQAASVVASAWRKQLRLKGAEDPRLEHFVRAFREGPQTPEPGAPCTGGKGSP